MRVRFIKDHKNHSTGDTAEVTPNEAHGLIELGVAMIAKDIIQSDYKIKVRSKRGRTSKPRVNKRS